MNKIKKNKNNKQTKKHNNNNKTNVRQWPGEADKGKGPGNEVDVGLPHDFNVLV